MQADCPASQIADLIPFGLGTVPHLGQMLLT